MVLVVPVHEILQDGATFPDLELVATLVRVDDGWNSAIRIYLKEKMLFLLMFKEFDDAYLEMDRVRIFKISI